MYEIVRRIIVRFRTYVKKNFAVAVRAFAQTVTDFADASHSKSAKSTTTTVLYGIFSLENSYRVQQHFTQILHSLPERDCSFLFLLYDIEVKMREKKRAVTSWVDCGRGKKEYDI